MPLNELKVQVESKHDIEYLRGEAARFLADKDGGLCGEECDKFLDSVFKIVCENVQVNGVDFEDVPVDEDVEAVDEKLVAELDRVQEDTEAILDQVIRFRRSFPGKTASRLTAELATLQLSLVGENTCANTADQNGINTANQDAINTADPDDIGSIDAALLGRVSNGVERSIGLQGELPKTIAKLERARTVLAEEGKKRLAAAAPAKPTGQWALAVGGSVGDSTPADLNDMLTRHRRTSHQFYLAHNLSAASHFN